MAGKTGIIRSEHWKSSFTCVRWFHNSWKALNGFDFPKIQLWANTAQCTLLKCSVIKNNSCNWSLRMKQQRRSFLHTNCYRKQWNSNNISMNHLNHIIYIRPSSLSLSAWNSSAYKLSATLFRLIGMTVHSEIVKCYCLCQVCNLIESSWGEIAFRIK